MLIVDDDPGVRDLHAAFLDPDYRVVTADTGDRALDLFDATVDVVLLDRQLGRSTGREVLDRIRDRGFDCRVAMVSALPFDADVADAPIDDYLTKPVSREQLAGTVDRLLARDGRGRRRTGRSDPSAR
ncbi:response regulator receiver protein [Candidatus Halobonum tyrrellensis G22]|uniref:Response regulator receiver protein n=1 Tax=Candidatus Halobonum tyrrellensis G22 TaxID=1324957 RepID=V4J0J2_9EURY|nr:response regulator receiver protein [Candidatus Halobonum tyrrellensis G22]